jgi:hypothetical protein
MRFADVGRSHIPVLRFEAGAGNILFVKVRDTILTALPVRPVAAQY